MANIEQLIETLLTVDGKGREIKREALIELINSIEDNEINIIRGWKKV